VIVVEWVYDGWPPGVVFVGTGGWPPGVAAVGWGWPPLVGGGRRWSLGVAAVGWGWLPLVGGGRRWSGVAAVGWACNRSPALRDVSAVVVVSRRRYAGPYVKENYFIRNQEFQLSRWHHLCKSV